MDNSLIRGPGRVVIGLMDGRMQTHSLVKFTPHLNVLPVEAQGGGVLATIAHKRESNLLPIDTVAYVAFLGTPASSLPPSSASSRTPTTPRTRIHVPGGKSFLVELGTVVAVKPGGFFAAPADPKSPFREFYFYDHGVISKERDEMLGAMLVKEGKITSEDIQRGLASRNLPFGQILVEQERINPESIEIAAALQERKRKRLGEVLLEAGLITTKDIDQALQEQGRRRGRKIGEILIEMGLITEHNLATTLAAKFDIQWVDLEKYPVQVEAAREVPVDIIRKYGFLPIATDERSLTIAISDPLYTEIHDVLRFHLQRKRILEVIADASQLQKFVATYLEGAQTIIASQEPEGGDLDAILKELLAGEEAHGAAEVAEEKAEKDVSESDSVVIKLANQIIIDAYRKGASDIHIEPNGRERTTLVRFRIDGDCQVYQEIPASYRGPLMARLKIMANLDISERRKPQDGKIRFAMRDKKIELRVATIPTVNNNEDAVLRILAGAKPMPLENMGLSERNLRELQRISKSPYGLILCVGPTGSGKTTTLHSVLGAINQVDTKIWTAEDPVEITQVGLRQVQVQAKIGFTFAAAMRAFLRADPDVIMVGEMRDAETAGTAVEAALTGHLVLSTLHTNTAPETVTRLLDMGIDPFSFSDALLGTLAQRLSRGLCKSCKEQYPAPEAERKEIVGFYGGEEALERNLGVKAGDLRLWRGKGCDACGGSGYKGRVGLHELLVGDDHIKEIIQRKGTAEDVRRAAMAGGMTTLMQDGIAKSIAGLTDLRQVMAVCSK